MSALQEVIDFIKIVREFRVNGELPFNTVDYMNMDEIEKKAAEELAALNARVYDLELDIGRSNGALWEISNREKPETLQMYQDVFLDMQAIASNALKGE